MIGGAGSLKSYLVILADSQKGKYFLIHMDTFEDQGEEIVDKVHKEVRSDNHAQNHIREQLHHHLKHVGEKAREYLVKKRIKSVDGVVIGGHKQLLQRVKQYLPTELKKNVVAEFVTELNLPVGDMTEKVLRVIA
jgi:peptide subunit release factor 1 (eRF1)